MKILQPLHLSGFVAYHGNSLTGKPGSDHNVIVRRILVDCHHSGKFTVHPFMDNKEDSCVKRLLTEVNVFRLLQRLD